MQVNPLLALILLAAVVVATFAVARWWFTRRPEPEVIALAAATKMLKQYAQAQTPEALVAAKAKEELRQAKLKEFQDLVAQLK